jgi:hypothetical protein
MKIIALDPGETTGYAIADWDGESEQAELAICGQVTGLVEFGRWLDIALMHGCYRLSSGETETVVIYETFRLYPHKAQALIANEMIASQVIGVIKFLCAEHPMIDDPVKQSASQAKGLLAHDWEQYLVSSYLARTDHQRDACVHVVYYMLSTLNRRKQDAAESRVL